MKTSISLDKKAEKSLSLLKKYDGDLLEPNQYKLREAPAQGEEQRNAFFRTGFKLKVLLECYHFKLPKLNKWLEAQGFDFVIANSHCSKSVGKEIPLKVLDSVINFVIQNKNPDNTYRPDPHYFEKSHNEFDALVEDALQLDETKRYLPPVYELSSLSEARVRDSIIKFIKRDEAFERVKAELTLHLRNNEPIFALFGAPTSDVNQLIEEWVSETVQAKELNTSVIALDLSGFSYVIEVLNEILRIFSTDSENASGQDWFNVDDVSTKRAFLQQHVSYFYEAIASKLRHFRYLFVFSNFKPQYNQSGADLPIASAINGRDWIQLVDILHELSIRNNDRIQVLFQSSDSPERYQQLLPIKAAVINIHAPSLSLVEELKRNSAYPLTAEIIKYTPKSLVSIREMRLLSIAENACNSMAETPYIHFKMSDFIGLAQKGKIDQIIYEWLKLCLVDWDDYYQKLNGNVPTAYSDYDYSQAEPIADRNRMMFLLLCGYAADGIKLSSAKYVIDKLKPQLDATVSYGTEAAQTANTFQIKPTELSRLLATILVVQSDHSDVQEKCFQFDDAVLKQIFCSFYTKELIDEEQKKEKGNVKSTGFIICNIRFLLSRLAFRTLLISYLPGSSLASHSHSASSIYDTIYEDSIFEALISSSGSLTKTTSHDEPPKVTLFRDAAKKMMSVERVPRADQILRISQIVDCLLHVAEPELIKNHKNYFEDTRLASKSAFETLIKDLLIGELIAESEPKNTSIAANRHDLETWTVKLIVYAYLLVYRLLDLQETYAASKIVNNGNNIRFSLLKRFFQLRTRGDIQGDATNEVNVKYDMGASNAVFPQSALIACVQGSLRSFSLPPLHHFLESVAISAINVGHFGMFMSIYSESNLFSNMLSAARRLATEQDDENSASKRLLKIVEDIAGDKNWPGYLTVFSVKAYLWVGQLHFARDIALSNIEEFEQRARFSDKGNTTLINTGDEEQGKYVLTKPKQDSAREKISHIKALLIRINTALGLYHDVIGALLSRESEQQDNIDFEVEQFSLTDKKILIEKFSSALRLQLINHPEFYCLTESNHSGKSVFGALKDRVAGLCESEIKSIHPFTTQERNPYNNRNPANNRYPSEMNIRRIRNKKIFDLGIAEYIHLRVLQCSNDILDTETALREQRLSMRQETCNRVGKVLDEITKITLFAISPFHHMTYEVAYLRYMLYKSLVKKEKPSFVIGSKIECMLEQKKNVYPLFYCQAQILHVEYLRQKRSFEPQNDSLARNIDRTLNEIEGLNTKYEYKDRMFELQLLREACNTENIDGRGYKDGDEVLWLVM